MVCKPNLSLHIKEGTQLYFERQQQLNQRYQF